MKKIFTLTAAFAMTMAASAQTVLWDGENAKIGSLGGLWNRSNPTVVENPDKSGINPSEKCVKFTMNGNENKQIAIPFRDWMTLDLKGNRRLSLMIKRSGTSNVEVQLENPIGETAASYMQHVAAWYDNAGEWQKVVFDFSTNEIDNNPTVIAITASTDAAGENEEVYIDNVVIEDVPMVNGVALSSIADGSLSGALVLTGSWMRGDCRNTDKGWAEVTYDDFATLKAKLTAGVTEADLTGAVLKDPYDVFTEVNPDMKVYTPIAFEGNTNIITIWKEDQNNHITACGNANVTLSRKMVANEWNTICLPFSLTADQVKAAFGDDVKVRGLNAAATQGNTLVFAEVTEIEAGKPYLISPTTEAEKYTFEGVNISAVKPTPVTGANNMQFAGTYNPADATDGTTPETCYAAFLGEGNKLYKAQAGTKMNGFRAYFLLPVNTDVQKVSLDLDGSTTGIGDINVEEQVKDSRVYNLNGQYVGNSLNGLKRGVYIQNGKKIMVN